MSEIFMSTLISDKSFVFLLIGGSISKKTKVFLKIILEENFKYSQKLWETTTVIKFLKL